MKRQHILPVIIAIVIGVTITLFLAKVDVEPIKRDGPTITIEHKGWIYEGK